MEQIRQGRLNHPSSYKTTSDILVHIFILYSKTRGPVLKSANPFLSRFIEETTMPFSLGMSIVFVSVIICAWSLPWDGLETRGKS